MRLSIWLALLFVVVSFISLSATYLVVRDAQEQEIRVSLLQDMAGFRAAPTSAALAALVTAQAEETDPERRLLSYLLPSGRIAGNAAIVQEAEGYRAIALGDRALALSGKYISLTEVINNGLLTVALTAEPLENLRRIFTRVFLFSLLPTCLIAIGIGFLLARRASTHLVAIEQTLSSLTQGDLSARVQMPDDLNGDLGRIGTSVNRMARVQQKSTAALTQISTDIAHDLKSPIQRVAVLLAQIREAKDLPEQAIELADQASAETESIVKTFQSLLQIAQVEGGTSNLDLAPLDLGALASTFAEIYAPVAEEDARQLVVNAPEEPVWVKGDATLLGQLLANLIENALRHTEPGIEICVNITTTTKTATLSVEDRGAGIPEEERQNVLRRLYRLEASRTTPGSGLGLSLVAAIAEFHDADLTLTSAKPGLKVNVCFDRIDAPSSV
ncbi:MAG: HAMP domain-containing sensor histidine kinase [Paracoccaceae bacterium]